VNKDGDVTVTIVYTGSDFLPWIHGCMNFVLIGTV